MEKEWHDSYKPAWGPGETLLYAIPGKVGNSNNRSAHTDPIMQKQKGIIVSEGRDIRFAKFTKTPHVSALGLRSTQFVLIKHSARSSNSRSATSSQQVQP